MPDPDVLVIEVDSDGTAAMLYRYTWDGGFGGDTWHPSHDGALKQAAFEYGSAVGPWIEVPSDIADPIGFARKLV